jgi:Flp pilus assembly protein TadB
VIPFVLALLFGAGVGLLFEGLTNPARPAPGAAPDAAPDGLRGTWGRRVREFLTRAGLHDVTPRDFVRFSLGAGLVAALGAQIVLGWGVVTALAGGLGLIGPFAYYVHRHDRRRAALQDALADAIAQLRDAIRTGLPMAPTRTLQAPPPPPPAAMAAARAQRASPVGVHAMSMS